MKTWALLFLLSGCTGAATVSADVCYNFTNCKAVGHPGDVSIMFPGGNAQASVDFSSASGHASSNCGFSSGCGGTADANFSDAITIYGTSGIIQAAVFSDSTVFFDGIADSPFRFGSLGRRHFR